MLIVLRGSSGSGKSTLASALQAELGWPTAVIGQDHFRRVVYREREPDGYPTGMRHAELMLASAMHCLGNDQHVIVEGILRAADYAGILQKLAEATDDARFFAFDLPFDETLSRHQTREEREAFSSADMRAWHRGWDPLPFVEEGRLTSELSLEACVARIVG